MTPEMTFPSPAQVQWGGLLGRALAASRAGHLAHFITDEASRPIALFHPECVAHNHEGDWYGEHAGKWLATAARAASRTSDAGLAANVRRVADYLVSVQAPDGYLGTYAPERRFMCQRGPIQRTWDGAPAVRTWDIWVHSYLILGLIEVNRFFPDARYLLAARRIGDLCWRTITEGAIPITSLGNHYGLSATVLIDPAVELYFATGEKKYLELAELILKQANDHPELALLSQALAGVDVAAISTGKAYQLCWNLVGIAKLHRATGDARYLHAVQQLWENIRQFHLTLGGGPWGGVAHRSREVFNPQTVFSPHGYVETCSTLAWIQLNRELLAITGNGKYAEEIEKSAYNDLLGAQAPTGDNWCYYSFPNGRRVYTTYWRCCKSSGPLALEELPSLAYGVHADGNIAINLYGPGRAEISTPRAGRVRLEQITRYPFDGAIRIVVQPEQAAEFVLLVRVPLWASEAMIAVNGVAVAPAHSAPTNSYVSLSRVWKPDDMITLQFAMSPMLRTQISRSVQESRAPDGSAISQEVMRYNYVAITRGPLVYATGLIDGFKMEETIRLPEDHSAILRVGEVPVEAEGPSIRLELGYRPPLVFLPYYEAGGRSDGTWRLTWLQVAPV